MSLDSIKAAPSRVYNRWKGLPLVPRILTGIGAAGATLTATGLLSLGVAYAVNKKGTRRFVANRAYNALGVMEGGTRKAADIFPRTEWRGFNAQGSISATGPGLLVGHKNFPVALKGDIGGGGVMVRFKPESLAARLLARGLISEGTAGLAAEYLPPEMYTGLELSPFPVAMGVAVDKDNAVESARRLGNLREALRPYTKYHKEPYHGWGD